MRGLIPLPPHTLSIVQSLLDKTANSQRCAIVLAKWSRDNRESEREKTVDKQIKVMRCFKFSKRF